VQVRCINDNKNIILLTLDLFAIRALEGLQLIREEKEILKEGRWKTETEEAVARAAKELWKTSACSVQSSEWLQSQGILYFYEKIYVLDLANV
jgi:hypothetical protein